jgi:hypothetical protein
MMKFVSSPSWAVPTERKRITVRHGTLGKLACSSDALLSLEGFRVVVAVANGTLRHLPGQISRLPQAKTKPVVDMANK